jgi:pilus assembly protein CpaB
MSIRTIATIAIAIVLGLIAVLLLNTYFGQSHVTPAQQAASGAAAAAVPVVVSATPIARGAALQPVLLKVVDYPQGLAPAGAFQAIGQLTGPANVQRLALRTFAAGEPILSSEVTAPGGRLNLSTVLEPGMQAVAVRSSDVAGVGGFLVPGDRVDVLLTRATSQADEKQNSITQVVAENVRVLGVDQSDNEEADKPTVAKAVTLEVAPAQAQAIALGQTVGTVSLSLRHLADGEHLAKRATTVADLGFVQVVKPPPAPRPPRVNPDDFIRVTRDTETSTYRVEGR